ncbi:MAG TPA: hypothetical protein VKM55_00370 [Candidatus Lokiarchaeia archaeon]|nr:hypothetical protein [Candidatus Lokiarchaeia archaeon]
MARPARKFHISFLHEDRPINLRGVLEFGAQELFIFKRIDKEAGISPDIKLSLAVHEILLPDHVGERCETIHETLDKFAFHEGVMTCVDVTNANMLDLNHLTTAMQAGLEQFHKMHRVKSGKFATAMLYQVMSDNIIAGHPLISTRNDIVQRIYWALLSSGEYMTKKDILEALNDEDDNCTIDDVTESLITVDNWLYYYPGYFKGTNNNRENVYQILPLEVLSGNSNTSARWTRS